MAKHTRRGPAGKIQSDSYPELRDELEREATRTKRLEGVKAQGERYQVGHLVEAVLAWYVAQPAEVRDRIVREGRAQARRYESAGIGAGAEDAALAADGHAPAHLVGRAVVLDQDTGRLSTRRAQRKQMGAQPQS